MDSTTGKISLTDQLTKSGDVANFDDVNPYANVNGTVSGLPSGQVVYISEAAAPGFTMPPFVPNALMYSFNIF